MSRLIDADVLRDSVKDIPMWGSVAAAMINAASTVDAVVVARGRWVITRPADSDGPALYKCSECEIKVGCKASNYCPNCGAKNLSEARE